MSGELVIMRPQRMQERGRIRTSMRFLIITIFCKILEIVIGDIILFFKKKCLGII